MSTAVPSAIVSPKPLRMFISYSHADDGLRAEFVKALSPLTRNNIVEIWHDRRIAPGDEWAGVIDDKLNSADLIILLVSNDFLDSDYCNEIEVKTALERHEKKLARVIPVILKPCKWQITKFARLNVLPRDGKPIVKWPIPEDGFLDVVDQLHALAKATPVTQAARLIPPKKPWPAIASTAVALTILIALLSWFLLTRHYISRGDQLLNAQDWDGAETAYGTAIRLGARGDHAYAGLGTIYDLRGNAVKAKEMFEAAVERSASQTNRSNLADEYFELGQYKRASDEYGKIPAFPYAAIQRAKISLLRNELSDAQEDCSVAIGWLNDSTIASKPENKLPWVFKMGKRGVQLVAQGEKLCYANFQLSIALALAGKEDKARQAAETGRTACGERLPDVTEEMKFEFKRLARERPEFSDKLSDYTSIFLTQ